MLTIGGRPLLWHVMRTVAQAGSREFVVALGHLGEVVKDFFLRFEAYAGDFALQLGSGSVDWLTEREEARWQVTCVDTGPDTGTGARLRQAVRHVSRWPILVAYGDVLANLDIAALVRYHRSHGRLATVTAAHPPSRFGVLTVTEDHRVSRFDEKLAASADWVNTGYFVLERAAVEDFVPLDRGDVMFEEDPIRSLVAHGQLMAFAHEGYWQPVDTPKDLRAVRALWDAGDAPWKSWKV